MFTTKCLLLFITDDSHMDCRLFMLVMVLLTFPFEMAKNKILTFQSECLFIALPWGEINLEISAKYDHDDMSTHFSS